MSDLDLYRERARQAEEEAARVTLPQNRRHYLDIARCWRELAESLEGGEGRRSAA